MVKRLSTMCETWVQSLGRKDPLEKEMAIHSSTIAWVKPPKSAIAWDLDSSQVGDGEGNGTPLQYPCLENPMDGGAWQAPVHGVAKSRAQLSDFTFTFHFHAPEKEMATHSSVLAWRIPGTAEPGGLPSMGSRRTRLKRLSSGSSSNLVNTWKC